MGAVNLLAAFLQISVPSCGLALLRRFGIQRVGWFLVICFASLALAHVCLDPLPSAHPWPWSMLQLDWVYGLASVLLLIGMAHLQILFQAHTETEASRDALSAQTQAQAALCASERARSVADLEQKLASQADSLQQLANSEAAYRDLFTKNPLPMGLLNLRTGCFLTVNDSLSRLCGFADSALASHPVEAMFEPHLAGSFRRKLALPFMSPASMGRWLIRTQDAGQIEAEITALDVSYGALPARLLVLRDLSGEERTQTELLRGQRLASTAQVAGGVAHHFNNLLTVINGHAHLLHENLAGTELAKSSEEILEAANRGAYLTRQLLAAGGKQPLNVQTLELNSLLDRLEPVMRRVVGKNITFQRSRTPERAVITADPVLIEKIVINLLLNARDAIRGPGKVVVNTSFAPAPEPVVTGRPVASCVLLTISDSGHGIQPEVHQHLFEPFVTTKDIGQGFGLGLAMVYALVRQHQGWIECIPGVDRGTEVKIYFPAAKSDTLSASGQSWSAVSSAKTPLLLVEPDQNLRSNCRLFLETKGYAVVEADCTTLALTLWQTTAAEIKILVIDPNLSGRLSAKQLIQTIRGANPSVQLVLTGAVPEDAARTLRPEDALLDKPFTIHQLFEAVKGVCSAAETLDILDLQTPP